MTKVHRVDLRHGANPPIQFAFREDEAAYHAELEALRRKLPEGSCVVAPRLQVLTDRRGLVGGCHEVSINDFLDECDAHGNVVTPAALRFERLLRAGLLVRR